MDRKYTPLDIYQELHTKAPGTAEGVGWRSYERQIARFGALLESVNIKEISTVLDAGCGYGEFYSFITAFRHFAEEKDIGDPFAYIGVDVHAEAIEYARRVHPDTSFMVIDVRDLAEMRYKFDLVVASGLLAFYPPLDRLQIVNRLWQMTEKVLSFNFKESESRRHDFDTLKTWIGFSGSSKWQINHSYLEDDVTVTIWRNEDG